MKTVWEFFAVMKEYFFRRLKCFIFLYRFAFSVMHVIFHHFAVGLFLIYILFENVANVEERFTMHKFLLPHILYLIIQ